MGNANCKSKCPSTCAKKTWQYWNGKIGSSKGTWDYDYGLKNETETAEKELKKEEFTQQKPSTSKQEVKQKYILTNGSFCLYMMISD